MKRLTGFFIIIAFLGFSASAHAQSWRMTEGGAGWTPATPTYGGLRPLVYFDPSKTNYAASSIPASIGFGVVSLVNYGNQSITGVSQIATPGSVPTLQSANGQLVFRFDGTDDFFQGPFGTTISQPFTVICAAQLDSTVVNNGVHAFVWDGDDATNRADLYKSETLDPDGWVAYAGSALDDGVADANWHTFVMVYNGASSVLYLNGVSVVSGNAGAAGLDGLTIGARYSGELPWKGNFGPFLIYSGVPSSADINQINAFLSKWGAACAVVP